MRMTGGSSVLLGGTSAPGRIGSWDAGGGPASLHIGAPTLPKSRTVHPKNWGGSPKSATSAPEVDDLSVALARTKVSLPSAVAPSCRPQSAWMVSRN
jgi:hypothetical protein